MKNKAFTLMEMMVVVVIIGILTSVALPQYRRLVDRSKFTKAQVMAKAMYDSCQRLIAEYGVESYSELPSSLRVIGRLDIGSPSLLPPGFTMGGNVITGAGFEYTLSGECQISILQRSGTYAGTKIVYTGENFSCSGNTAGCDVYGLN